LLLPVPLPPSPPSLLPGVAVEPLLLLLWLLLLLLLWLLLGAPCGVATAGSSGSTVSVPAVSSKPKTPSSSTQVMATAGG
jgi:hypothetical protein